MLQDQQRELSAFPARGDASRDDVVQGVTGEKSALDEEKPRDARLEEKSAIAVAGGDAPEGDGFTPPFLKLPPELRNRTYELVLGGNMIHIMKTMPYMPSRLRALVCTAKKPLTTIKADQEEEDSVCRMTTRYSMRADHHPCRDFYPKTCLPLGLLGVCRQIQAEAALIPFSSNTFDIETYAKGIQNFAAHLTDAQLGAIQSLTVDFSNGKKEELWIDPAIVKRMPSVKAVTIIASMYALPGAPMGLHTLGALPRLSSLDGVMVVQDHRRVPALEAERACGGIVKLKEIVLPEGKEGSGTD
ncbi:hypothetical protein M409DRAFT_23156 [Zasmidium cellare ATCC 36951]|uniref:DUF7730 domain-containing protein n=1 Tax=Zasmidium cellare ATCC 36951 TaxID=1080233 RepID=A0A6A6CJY9_ZASCE|nr:uncharacterized protein M409DRAFT_23156 [Zasmidium cellare ATCC 36951]KAF2166518.1 hypothetical protein M409DRAFT_23156 [Zasmidium cellare ATCC 36951]